MFFGHFSIIIIKITIIVIKIIIAITIIIIDTFLFCHSVIRTKRCFDFRKRTKLPKLGGGGLLIWAMPEKKLFLTDSFPQDPCPLEAHVVAICLRV